MSQSTVVEPNFTTDRRIPSPNQYGFQPHYMHTSKPQGIWVVYYTNGHGEDTIPMTYYFEEIDALRDALDEPGAKVLFWKEGQPWLEALSDAINRSR